MGILGDAFSLASSIKGKAEGKKKNAAVAQQYNQQQGYAKDQIDLANLIEEITRGLSSQGSGYEDVYGGGAEYDPVTGRWVQRLGGAQAANQAAADTEELNRYTLDQEMRRNALRDIEGRRDRASGEANTALLDLNNFKSGIGAVDANDLASQLRLNRTGAVNAGYDDAATAARTLSLRTGASAGDALSGIARNRARSIATSMGDPEVEALNLAEGVNNNRLGNLTGLYGMFSDQANNMYDAGFAPAGYADRAADRGLQSQQIDLSKVATALEGAGSGAAVTGSAARGMREAAGQQQANTDYNLGSKFLRGAGNAADSMVKNLYNAFGGGGGLKGMFTGK